MIFEGIRLWWFYNIIKPTENKCFKFKGYKFVTRLSKSGNLCMTIYKKAKETIYNPPIAELVVHNGRMDLTHYSYQPERHKIIYTMYDMWYGRNNFLHDADAYEILSKVVFRLNHYDESKRPIKEADYREVLKQLEKLRVTSIKLSAI